MPQQNSITAHFTPADQVAWAAAMQTLRNIVQPRLRNLSKEENKRLGKFGRKKKLLIDKVNDYRDTQPHLSSGDVDWAEFKLDCFDSKFLETGIADLLGLIDGMSETKRLHDFDNYMNARLDYNYAKYKERTEKGLGYDSKVKELKQFFPRSKAKIK
jgi:hypothetical protein